MAYVDWDFFRDGSGGFLFNIGSDARKNRDWLIFFGLIHGVTFSLDCYRLLSVCALYSGCSRYAANNQSHAGLICVKVFSGNRNRLN